MRDRSFILGGKCERLLSGFILVDKYERNVGLFLVAHMGDSVFTLGGFIFGGKC